MVMLEEVPISTINMENMCFVIKYAWALGVEKVEKRSLIEKKTKLQLGSIGWAAYLQVVSEKTRAISLKLWFTKPPSWYTIYKDVKLRSPNYLFSHIIKNTRH